MRIFWSDREGIAAPKEATFHFRPFYSGSDHIFTPEFVSLPSPQTFKVLKRTFLPDFATWKAGVERALSEIRREGLEKVVLGRICQIDLADEPDPFAIAAALKETAVGAFVFCAEMPEGTFLGASPERLFSRKGKTLLSEAIAGTRPIDCDPLELLQSPKDLREFSPVQTYLQKALSPLCDSPVTFSPISIHQSGPVQHLYSQCAGTLKENTSDDQILSELHPTPALCGTPTQKAYSLIQELEPFDRAFFGGALGWTTTDASEWIVGIRSCFIKGKRATLFSGTGIVEGSDPQEEWDELNQKLKLYDRILVD